METSYFSHPGISSDPRAVSIARYAPRWWGKGRRFIQLAPSAALLQAAKDGLLWPEYVRRYNKEVLSILDPASIYAELQNSILICYERDPRECHRSLVASWIEQALGVIVLEMTQARVH